MDGSVDPAQFARAAQRLERLGRMIQAQREARHAATLDEFFFHMANNTRQVVGYRQAVVWSVEGRPGGRIAAVSGLPETEPEAPYTVWMSKVLRHIGVDVDRAATPIESKDVPPDLRDQWPDWLPAFGLSLGLIDPVGRPLGALFLAREEAWDEDDEYLLAQLADAYAHAWANLLARRSLLRRAARHAIRRRIPWLVAAMLAGAMFIPMRQSVLAPAEVVASNPTIVRARIDGVVNRIHVAPNEPVREGQLVFDLDATDLRNRLQVAQQALEVARAEYRVAAQKAVFDNKSRSRLAVLKGKMDTQAAKVKRVADQLRLVEVRAARPGLALYADPNDWIGRPVVAGEKIMQIADPAAVELDIMLPVSDAINLEPGAEVVFFLNIDPENPLRARLRSSSFRATATAEGNLAYRLKADIADAASPPRIGLRGTAKIFGAESSMFFFLFRKPLAKARQWLGL